MHNILGVLIIKSGFFLVLVMLTPSGLCGFLCYFLPSLG